MEENMAKLFQEQLPSVEHLTGELYRNKNPKQDDWNGETTNHCHQELAEEEQKLRTYLDKLKKENFTLRSSIKAWQKTLEVKLDEFKEDTLKLEEIYKEIWSEREKFCSKLEKFNEQYGVLSSWWEAQIRFVSGLENPGEKASEEQRCKQEVEELERQIAELKKEIEQLQKPVMEVDATEEGEPSSVRKESESDLPQEDVPLENKENETSKRDSAIDLYSVVDLEKVKMAKWRRKVFSSRGGETANK